MTIRLRLLFAVPFAVALAVGAPCHAQSLPAAEDFSAPMDPRWTRLETVEDGVNPAARVEQSGGHLIIEPIATSWAGDWHGFYLFRPIKGDFVATVRIRSTGLRSDIPGQLWSLAGLMARAPRAGAWEARRENWVHITTGVADTAGLPMLETKTVTNSVTNLKLLPVPAGWIDLRLARVGPNVLLLWRKPGERWRLRERFFRNDLPETLQVGITAYSNGRSARQYDDARAFNLDEHRGGTPDLRVLVDSISFSAPRIPPGRPPWFLYTLTDYDFPEADLLAMVGDG